MDEQPIVHVGTRVEVTFGRLDAEGDVVDPRPFRFTLLKLDERAFAELRQAIYSARVQLEAEMAMREPPVTEAIEGERAPL